MPKRKRSSYVSARRSIRRKYAATSIQGAFRKWRYQRRRKRFNPRASVKRNYRAIQKLKREKENKWHYTVVPQQNINEIQPSVQCLVQVPSSTSSADVNARVGDALTAKYINVHGKLYFRGNQSGPSRVTLLLVRSEQDTGSILTPPQFANLFDIASLGVTQLPYTSAFRLINNESLTKVKILKRKDIMMAPGNASFTAGAAPGTELAKQTSFPNVVHWKMEHRCMDAKLTYVNGTATPLNAHYWLMAITDDDGVAPNSGPYMSYISKFRFSDSGS